MIERTEAPSAPAAPARTWDVAIVGAGYVGVPLARSRSPAVPCCSSTSSRTSSTRSTAVSHVEGRSRRRARPARGRRPDLRVDRLRQPARRGRDRDRAADAAVETAEPDLSILLQATREIAKRLGQLVVLESTTYPGTTREQLPLLEAEAGFAWATTSTSRSRRSASTPARRGTCARCRRWSAASPRHARRGPRSSTARRSTRCTVSSPEAAELTKLLENIFRSVNIALVNELAQLAERMDIDVWEVVDAAATKPFGFAVSFKPGPGLGGHCIPIDPFYLTWKAREYGFTTEFIELAGRVNESMPYYCRSLISQALNHAKQKSMSGARVLILGVAYKPDIGDVRESPA